MSPESHRYKGNDYYHVNVNTLETIDKLSVNIVRERLKKLKLHINDLDNEFNQATYNMDIVQSASNDQFIIKVAFIDKQIEKLQVERKELQKQINANYKVDDLKKSYNRFRHWDTEIYEHMKEEIQYIELILNKNG